VVQLLDRVEERRSLNTIEINLRIRLKTHIYELASLAEAKWQQRSSIRWLRLGDNNTTYFHAIASNKRKTNYITLIQMPNNIHPITHTLLILNAFSDFYKGLLGTNAPSSESFDYSLIQPSEIDLSSLANSFT
jgi:hypothetical protein